MATRVLVVEDDASIRTLLRYALEEEGYRVACARDGREALERVERDRPDAIVLDLQLPVMDGAGFARALARRTGGDAIPVLVVSGDYAAHRIAAELGAAGCLAKPFELDALLEAVGRLAAGGLVPAGGGA